MMMWDWPSGAGDAPVVVAFTIHIPRSQPASKHTRNHLKAHHCLLIWGPRSTYETEQCALDSFSPDWILVVHTGRAEQMGGHLLRSKKALKHKSTQPSLTGISFPFLPPVTGLSSCFLRKALYFIPISQKVTPSWVIPVALSKERPSQAGRTPTRRHQLSWRC